MTALPRILMLADPHLTEKPIEEYRHNFMIDLLEIIRKRKPDAVAILGDLTEEKDRHNAKLVNRIVQHMDAIAELCPLLIMMGNHDYRNEGHPFFAFLSRIRNIAWVDKPSLGRDLPAPFNALFRECLFLPHTNDYKRDWEKVKLKLGYRYIFAHNCFAGTQSNDQTLDGIPTDIFPPRQQVIAGDIHIPQKVGPVTYIGAPYTIDFGDDYEPRLIMGDSYQWFAISLKAWPQKRLLAVDDLGELMKQKVNAGDIVKVRINQDDIGNWGSIHRDIIAWCKKKQVQLFRAEPIMHAAMRRNVRVRAAEKVDDAAILRDYAKMHSLTDDTLKIGLEFLK